MLPLLMDREAGWIGAVLNGKWRIDAKIGRGGVASVFRATHRQGNVAAIKIMHDQFAADADARARFLREGYAANKVHHPGVVRVLDDAIAEDGSPYLVMELLDDGELLEHRREKLGGAMPIHEVVQVADQLLDVLASAHAKGVVHRDVKPDNIFILSNGSVKVLDFGIALIREAARRAEPTQTGLLLGTPDFMSPEQALGRREVVDAQSDLYGVGATMFTLISAEAVHLEDNLPALLASVAMKQARSLGSVARRGIPPELVAVVDQALALEKRRRWTSARAMQAALRAFAPQLAKGPRPLSHVTRPTETPITKFDVTEPMEVDRSRMMTVQRPSLVVAPPPPSGRAWSNIPQEPASAPVTPRVDLGAPTLRDVSLLAASGSAPPSSSERTLISAGPGAPPPSSEPDKTLVLPFETMTSPLMPVLGPPPSEPPEKTLILSPSLGIGIGIARVHPAAPQAGPQPASQPQTTPRPHPGPQATPRPTRPMAITSPRLEPAARTTGKGTVSLPILACLIAFLLLAFWAAAAALAR